MPGHDRAENVLIGNGEMIAREHRPTGLREKFQPLNGRPPSQADRRPTVY
jgi:hypothetical protein